MIEQLKQIVIEAGEILKEGYNSEKKLDNKGLKDLITDFDIKIENFLIENINKNFNEFTIIAEESRNDLRFTDNMIFIDPIDGTTNFVKNVPNCAISIGVYKNAKPYVGIVYNPISNELYCAQIGKGATLNGKKIEMSIENNFQSALIGTGFPYTSAENEDDLYFVISRLKNVLPKCQDIRRMGSAALDLCMVAKGTFEGYYEININSWDVVAGIIILQEAGGIVTNHLGEEYNFFEDKCIVATNGKIHKSLLKELQ